MKRLALVCVIALTGCSADQQDVQNWMAQTRTSTQPSVKPLAPQKDYVPKEYTERGGVEPFTYLKIASLNAAANQSPDGNRPREPLEEIPLDAIKMVGALQKGGQTHAMLSVDGKVVQVKVGQYIGQNFGKIVKITEGGLTLRELVKDGAGEWVSKMTEIKLQAANSQETKK